MIGYVYILSHVSLPFLLITEMVMMIMITVVFLLRVEWNLRINYYSIPDILIDNIFPLL